MLINVLRPIYQMNVWNVISEVRVKKLSSERTFPDVFLFSEILTKTEVKLVFILLIDILE